jgi:hypothetical protein
MNLQEIADRGVHCRRYGHNVTFLMTKSLDPFRFLLMAVCGWMICFGLSLVRGVSAGCYQPPAVGGIFPTLSL